MVELVDEPVAVVEAQAGTELSSASETEIIEKIEAAQDDVVEAIQAQGGSVGNRMHSAYNGMRVTIDASQLDAIAELPEVKAVHDLPRHERSNSFSVPGMGTPGVWQGGFTGKGVKIVIIDSGIDYTHATFGGEGTPEAFDAATAATDPTDYYGPRVKGGYDFAGDAYSGSETPQPDANPIDCASDGHGTHVAGTAAGSGVLADGATYTGPYDSTTHENEFRVGPGVAPEAELYALKVFGCGGSTTLIPEAIDWAVKNDMDVINLSLGSRFGRATDPDSVAASNAVAAGVVVVAAAGNDGASPYLAARPSAGAGVLSVAASDGIAQLPAAEIGIDGATIQAINANGATLPASGPLYVLRKDGELSEGCDQDEYRVMPVRAIVVTRRGGCSRVKKAILAQKFGATGAIMINDADSLPPYEGLITGDPETGEQWRVRIPFLGIKSSDAEALIAAEGKTITFSANALDNPAFGTYGDFSSSGPRWGDSGLRPSVTAPGVSVLSAQVGTGTRGKVLSGTSMATPHVAGVVALAIQAHPEWSSTDIAAAVVNTADAEKVPDYKTSRGGGRIDPAGVVATDVVALADPFTVDGAEVREPTLSFGFKEFADQVTEERVVTLVNRGREAASFTAVTAPSTGSRDATVTVTPASVTVPAGQSVDVTVKLEVNGSAVPSSIQGSSSPWFYEVSGNVRFEREGGETLSVPYLLVPRTTSDVTATQTVTGTVNDITFANGSPNSNTYTAVHTWGLRDPEDIPDALDVGQDLASVGVASYGNDQLGRTVHFALNSSSRFSNPARLMYTVDIDNNVDGKADFRVLSVDSGFVRTLEPNGIAEVFVANLETGAISVSGNMTLAPTDSSTVILPVEASQLGITGKFTYTATATDLLNPRAIDTIDGWAAYDPTNKPFQDGQFLRLDAGASKTIQVERNEAAYADQQPLGYLAVAFDNPAGASEAVTGEVKAGDGEPPTPEPSESPTPAPTDDPAPTVSPTAVPTGDPAPTDPVPSPTGRPTPVPVKPGPPKTGVKA
ncbi:MAG: S8 family serine peptidase [Propionibacteriaceae bacterium]|nr:S8 family serine peptidase [Propionibacteriaceae bacterium]